MTRRRPPLQNNSAKADAQISGLANVEDTSLDASGGRPILIEIDPVISGGEAHGRFDVMVRGRVVSPAAIKEIRLQVDGWVTSIASFGQPDSAPSAFMPDGSPARQRVFQFNLPRPGDGRTERCAFQIVAHIEDGFEYVEDFEIEIDPTAGEAVSIVSGSIRSAPGASGPHAILYLERATINAQGGLFLQGWAVSLGTILAVQVFAGEMQVAEARIGEERDDVAAAFPAYPNSRFAGFSLALELDEVARKADRIRAQVVCVDGFFHAESVPIEVAQLGAERGLHHGHELVPDAPLSQQAVASANQTLEFGVREPVPDR